jgi:hypothetical protein
MTTDEVQVPASQSSATVTVRRKNNLRGDVEFSWWTESGTAKPTADFTPVAPHTEQFSNGKSSMTLAIPLAANPRAKTKSFYVVIDQSEPGAVMGGRTLTMVTLLPAE